MKIFPSVLPILLAFSAALPLVAAPAQSQPPAPMQPPIVGDFRPASVKEPEVVMAAKFAVQVRAKTSHQKIALLSIQRAEKQLVAGMNYRVALKVKIKGKVQNVKATVYKDLQDKSLLSEWVLVK